MKKRRETWYNRVKECVRAYPLQNAAMDAIEQARIAGETPPAEAEVSETQQSERDAVTKAINMTLDLEYGKHRLAVIDMVFWSRTHTIADAARACFVSERTAQRWQSEFFRCVASHLGLT